MTYKKLKILILSYTAILVVVLYSIVFQLYTGSDVRIGIKEYILNVWLFILYILICAPVIVFVAYLIYSDKKNKNIKAKYKKIKLFTLTIAILFMISIFSLGINLYKDIKFLNNPKELNILKYSTFTTIGGKYRNRTYYHLKITSENGDERDFPLRKDLYIKINQNGLDNVTILIYPNSNIIAEIIDKDNILN